MNQGRYILQPYKGQNSRFKCPSCRHREKTFSRYVDLLTGESIAPYVGRCNREINCGYHFPPKKYFEHNPHYGDQAQTKPPFMPTGIGRNDNMLHSVLPDQVFEASFSNSAQNNFIDYLITLFGTDLTRKLVDDYFIASSKLWKGATVFWQVDLSGQVRTGKIILYNPKSGKRVKEPFNHIAWAHLVLRINNFNLKQCFFGEHLLNFSLDKPVAIVESEKSAIIASVFMPQFIWLASGGLSNLGIDKFRNLKGRRIILFPDLKGFKKWKQKAKEIERFLNCKILVSDFLELNASDNEKELGLDIADYLIERDEKYGWALSEYQYPAFWDY